MASLIHTWLGQQVKPDARKLEGLSLVPGTHTVEGEI